MRGLQGKIGIVAGGGAGLGRATANRLASEGVSVVVADINESAAETAAEAIRSAGGDAIAVVVDISSEDQVGAMVDRTLEKYDRVDLLHNVAFDVKTCMEADFDLLGTTLDTFDHTIAVDLRGYILTCRAVLPHMIEGGGGAIVNTSSLAAIRVLRTGNRYSYSIAKAGLSPLTQHIAVKYGKQNIRCNTAAMGLVLSESSLQVQTPERLTEIRASTLLPDAGDPDKLASSIVFLLSDDACYITGQVINIDAGASSFFG
ncbi:MAG: SDR family NAD(P)-dependent oxidoreductase [bacterium]|nr:SDR family NAD(P)-dependent oxidoreductase [bacterium]